MLIPYNCMVMPYKIIEIFGRRSTQYRERIHSQAAIFKIFLSCLFLMRMGRSQKNL